MNMYGGGLSFAFIKVPRCYTFLSAVVFLGLVFLVLFLFNAKFSEKVVVQGFLNSTKGLVRVFPVKNGVVGQTFIKQGDVVCKNDPLFRIDTSFDQSCFKKHGEILAQYVKHKQAILREIAYKNKELAQLKPLVVKNYLPKVSYQQLQDVVRQLKERLILLKIEILQHKKSCAYVITAPVAGTIANQHVHPGQYVEGNKPIASILPSKAKLQAELLVPLKKAGFLHTITKVIIHYDAYPYTRFGSFQASIRDISLSPIQEGEADEGSLRIGEPYYKVTANLEKQGVMLYGRLQSLQQGMTLSAILIGRRQTLMAWILDPLYSFKGNLWL